MTLERQTNFDSSAIYFSIVIVTFNAENSILSTLRSLQNQTYQGFEVIIVDGCSQDRTVELIKSSGIHVAHFIVEPDKGIYDAMNKGMELAQGSFISFLNEGDMFVVNGLELVMNHVFDSEVRLFSLDYEVYSPRSQEKKKRIHCRPLEMGFLKKDFKACHQSIFARRDLCVKYNLDYDILADYQWAIDMSSKCLSESEIRHVNVAITEYERGGYSAQSFVRNIGERIKIHYYNFGIIQVLLNIPNYLRRVLRALKASLVK